MKLILTLLLLFFSNILICNAQFISADDRLHLGAGALVSGVSYTVYSATKNKKKAFWYSLGASALAGIAKEAIDLGQNERFDTGEIVATTAGGLFMSTTLSLFIGNKKKAVALVN
ncbi:hypothetical protein [Tamlana crocina]|uniref:Lipoprotein n=1 Tax=Tamlana crocina TaxID=393006 RepID=A0ABX1DBA6_9FLAO|nr:hypothetical protein [Tamlana crocina]NJX15639.1 hypothetical protein [Tamlana crocina]